MIYNLASAVATVQGSKVPFVLYSEGPLHRVVVGPQKPIYLNEIKKDFDNKPPRASLKGYCLRADDGVVEFYTKLADAGRYEPHVKAAMKANPCTAKWRFEEDPNAEDPAPAGGQIPAPAPAAANVAAPANAAPQNTANGAPPVVVPPLPQAPPVQPAQAQVAPPARPASTPGRFETLSLNGAKAVDARLAAELEATSKVPDVAANASFSPGFGAKCEAILSRPLFALQPNVFSALTKKVDPGYLKHREEMTTDSGKANYDNAIREDGSATALVEVALLRYQQRNSPANVDALEQACAGAFETYRTNLNKQVQRLNNKKASMPLSAGAAIEQEKADWIQGPAAERLFASAGALFQVRLKKNPTLLRDLGAAITAAETDRSETNAAAVMGLADKYLEIVREYANAYRSVRGVTVPENIVQLEALAQRIQSQAEDTLFDLKLKRLGPPPWPTIKQREGDDLLDLGRQVKAKAAIRKNQQLKQQGGSSTVRMIGDGAGKVEYAFKPASGEDPAQSGMPKGSGVIREAVTSKVVDAVLRQTGFDFGFPQTTIATLDGKPGALIEGLNGRLLLEAGSIPYDKRDDVAKFQHGIPGKQLQKAICAGLAVGNFLDIKWDNVFWEGEGANINARPFDSGNSFLPTNSIKRVIHGGGDAPRFDVLLLQDANGKPVKGGDEPLDQEIVDAMLKIDLVAVSKTIDDETQRHAASGLGALLDNESKLNGLRTLRTAQMILKKYEADFAAAQQAGNGAPPQRPSLFKFVEDMQQSIYQLFPAS